ncbi:stage III sporulation protein AC [Thermincola ferriacetica]|uniref:Stage III sporulation protein AC n=2 Tax=Thermincola TaxID=278993 RepID=D5X7K5_THEPJ|nr:MULTISPECIES: stage III sporulation protein AC [Thermincola]ADG82575.1 stage III sporulation protein AC [Thermincola potens JR]KNZ70710.1 stage III sporulation protein AC [Thermincola ferriacetica]
MDIDLIFQLAGISIVITVIYTVLKQAGRDEYAFATLLLGIVIVLAMVIPRIANLFDTVKDVFNLY